MTTKQIGNIGEAKVLSEFVRLGIPVYLPFGDNEKSDLIADFNGKLNRIQVKTSQKIDGDKIVFSLVSSTIHRKNGVKHIYTNNEIDYFALYNLERDKVYLISINEENLPKTSITIKFSSPKTKNQFKVFLEQDYLIDNVIKQDLIK